jgi:hypothetical protein
LWQNFFVSIHGVIELVEIPNNKSQKTNKLQSFDLPFGPEPFGSELKAELLTAEGEALDR